MLSCNIYLRSKNPQHRPYELLQLLPIPKPPWSSVSMDFIINLPPSNSFDCICVIIDQFSKMAHFVPCKKTITSADTAKLFIDNIYRYHGLPNDIVSNQGSQFVSKFWLSLFKILHVKIKLSSAIHPQIDGQTEWVNQVFEQYLHCTVNYQ